MMASVREKTINVVESRQQVVQKLAQLIKTASDQSIADHTHFTIGVSGGSLVGLLRDGLPTIKTDFSKWKVFFCDERVVPEDSPDSTFGQYKKHIMGAVNLSEKQFFPIKQGVAAADAAKDYIDQMAPHFVDTPRFDMLLLGMGPDGHTCSLFPRHKLLDEDKVWVMPITDSPKPPPARITITYPIINRAAYCVFAVCGEEKAEMVKRILIDREDLPATRVKPKFGNLVWILDHGAGKHLL